MSDAIRKNKKYFSFYKKSKSTFPHYNCLTSLVALLVFALMFFVGGCSAEETSLEIPSESSLETGRETAEDFGADAFRMYYSWKAETDTDHDYSHMDLEKLSDMASETVGTISDTDEITIEVMGAIISGSRAEVILRVTANQLDTVLYGDEESNFDNIRFGDETASFMRIYNFDSLSYRYFYSDEDDRLASNQFELHYWIKKESFDQDQYTVELTDLGYYDPSTGKFSALYTGNWQVNISFVPISDTSKSVDISQEIMVDDYKFILEVIQFSPLGCSVNLACEENDAYVTDNFNDIYNALLEKSKNCSLMLADGTKLDSNQFYTEYSSKNDFNFYISFFGPMAIDDIVLFSLGETDFSV